MRYRVEAFQSEEGRGTQQGNAEWSLLEQLPRQPARGRERWKQQRIGPDQEASANARQYTEPTRASPEQPENHGRGELGNGGKGDEPDRHQAITLVNDPHVGEAEQNDEPYGAASDAEQNRTRIGAQLTDPQQHRNHEVVADHSTERDGLDDHHASGGRESAEERQKRKPIVTGSERQRENERVRIGVRRRAEQPGQRDRHYEQIDSNQISREQPKRAVKVAFVYILDDHDLELPRQANDGRHGQKGQCNPLDAGC